MVNIYNTRHLSQCDEGAGAPAAGEPNSADRQAAWLSSGHPWGLWAQTGRTTSSFQGPCGGCLTQCLCWDAWLLQSAWWCTGCSASQEPKLRGCSLDCGRSVVLRVWVNPTQKHLDPLRIDGTRSRLSAATWCALHVHSKCLSACPRTGWRISPRISALRTACFLDRNIAILVNSCEFKMQKTRLESTTQMKSFSPKSPPNCMPMRLTQNRKRNGDTQRLRQGSMGATDVTCNYSGNPADSTVKNAPAEHWYVDRNLCAG